MLKEDARVIAREQGSVWVEAVRSTGHCQGCAANSSCGHALLDRLHPARNSPLRIPFQGDRLPRPGDIVSLSLPAALVMKLSLIFYLLPLSGLLCGALLAGRLGAGEFLTVLGALAGLAGGFLAVRLGASRLARQADFQAMAGMGPALTPLSTIRSES